VRGDEKSGYWSDSRGGGEFVGATSPTGGSTTMLWTILIVLAIVALALFIVGQLRGRRGL
jgi:hypothetical protein